MSGDVSGQPPKRKPIVWNLNEQEAGKSGGSIIAGHRDSSPSVRQQSGGSKRTRSRSRSPWREAEIIAEISTKNLDDLRWGSARINGRRKEYDRHHGVNEDLRRRDVQYRRKYDPYSVQEASPTRRGHKLRFRGDEQQGRDPDSCVRTKSRPGSNEGQDVGRRHLLPEKGLLEMSYEEYLAVFGQVQDEWRKRKVELGFINSQLPFGPG